MKYVFKIYPDPDLTYIAQQILLDKWVEEHDSDLTTITSASIKHSVISVVARSLLTSADLQQDYYNFVESQIN